MKNISEIELWHLEHDSIIRAYDDNESVIIDTDNEGKFSVEPLFDNVSATLHNSGVEITTMQFGDTFPTTITYIPLGALATLLRHAGYDVKPCAKLTETEQPDEDLQ